MVLSVDDVIELTDQWRQKRSGDIARVWPLNGGWEAWAQAEIAAWLLYADHANETLREQRVYANDQRADLLVNPTSNGADMIVIELKCQSLPNWRAFVPGLQEDYNKLRGAMRPAYQDAHRLVLGIGTVPNEPPPAPWHIRYEDNGETCLYWAAVHP
ncbi:MAG: hypothetical protein ACPHID_07595 [Thermoplasmatota archaeon]